jgi:hypothetical protein
MVVLGGGRFRMNEVPLYTPGEGMAASDREAGRQYVGGVQPPALKSRESRLFLITLLCTASRLIPSSPSTNQ